MVFSLLDSYREEKDWPSLLNLGSCGSILITNSFKLECRQVNEICGKFSLITLYQRKYICELVKLMLSYWGNSLLKFCCWHTSKYTHHCSSPKDKWLHLPLSVGYFGARTLLCILHYIWNLPSNWFWPANFFFSGWNVTLV